LDLDDPVYLASNNRSRPRFCGQRMLALLPSITSSAMSIRRVPTSGDAHSSLKRSETKTAGSSQPRALRTRSGSRILIHPGQGFTHGGSAVTIRSSVPLQRAQSCWFMVRPSNRRRTRSSIRRARLPWPGRPQVLTTGQPRHHSPGEAHEASRWPRPDYRTSVKTVGGRRLVAARASGYNQAWSWPLLHTQ